MITIYIYIYTYMYACRLEPVGDPAVLSSHQERAPCVAKSTWRTRLWVGFRV